MQFWYCSRTDKGIVRRDAKKRSDIWIKMGKLYFRQSSRQQYICAAQIIRMINDTKKKEKKD